MRFRSVAFTVILLCLAVSASAQTLPLQTYHLAPDVPEYRINHQCYVDIAAEESSWSALKDRYR